MGKITPQEYIDVEHSLAQAGFMAIRELLDAVPPTSITDLATRYGIEERAIEIVKTTSSYGEYETIRGLELERQGLKTELEEVKTTTTKPPIAKPYYYVAGVILLAIVGLIVWGVWALINFIGGLF